MQRLSVRTRRRCLAAGALHTRVHQVPRRGGAAHTRVRRERPRRRGLHACAPPQTPHPANRRKAQTQRTGSPGRGGGGCPGERPCRARGGGVRNPPHSLVIKMSEKGAGGRGIVWGPRPRQPPRRNKALLLAAGEHPSQTPRGGGGHHPRPQDSQHSSSWGRIRPRRGVGVLLPPAQPAHVSRLHPTVPASTHRWGSRHCAEPPNSRETMGGGGGHSYVSQGAAGEPSILLVEVARRE